MQVQEDADVFTHTMHDRHARVDYLLEAGVNPQVLRAVVMDRVAQNPNAVEALGLLTALKSLYHPAKAVS